MQWYKHMTNMLDDPFVQDELIPEWGMLGYAYWCALLEIYAKEWDGSCTNDQQKLHIPSRTLQRKLHISGTKVERFLQFCATFGKLSITKVQKSYIIEIPKMKDLRDEWGSRKKTKIGSDSGATREPYKEEEKEEDKEKEREEEKNSTPDFLKSDWEKICDAVVEKFKPISLKPTEKLKLTSALRTVLISKRTEHGDKLLDFIDPVVEQTLSSVFQKNNLSAKYVANTLSGKIDDLPWADDSKIKSLQAKYKPKVTPKQRLGLLKAADKLWNLYSQSWVQANDIEWPENLSLSARIKSTSQDVPLNHLRLPDEIPEKIGV